MQGTIALIMIYSIGRDIGMGTESFAIQTVFVDHTS